MKNRLLVPLLFLAVLVGLTYLSNNGTGAQNPRSPIPVKTGHPPREKQDPPPPPGPRSALILGGLGLVAYFFARRKTA